MKKRIAILMTVILIIMNSSGLTVESEQFPGDIKNQRAEAAVTIKRLSEIRELEKGLRVSRVTGKAYDSDNNLLQEGLIIYPGESIITEAGGEVVLTADDTSTIHIGPKSNVLLEKRTENLTNGESHTSISVWAGKIYGRVQKLLNNKSTFEINSPSVIAGIRGTTFSVDVSDDGATEVSVYVGRVAVTARSHQENSVLIGSKEKVNLQSADDKTAVIEAVDFSELSIWDKNALEESLIDESKAAGAEIGGNTGEDQTDRLDKMLNKINDTKKANSENKSNSGNNGNNGNNENNGNNNSNDNNRNNGNSGNNGNKGNNGNNSNNGNKGKGNSMK